MYNSYVNDIRIILYVYKSHIEMIKRRPFRPASKVSKSSWKRLPRWSMKSMATEAAPKRLKT